MDAKDRRNALHEKLAATDEPLTGTVLASQFGVSRQVIVGDIAILRAAGVSVFATPQGYMLPRNSVSAAVTAKIACGHSLHKLEEELAIIIDNGGKVLDVIVEHPIYGEIKANLMLSSRCDLTEFISQLSTSAASPLSSITDGIHLHTIEVPSRAILAKIKQELRVAGILLR
jgi:uncharacterized protein